MDIELGYEYSKKELADFLNEPNLKLFRKGVYHLKLTNDTQFFVDTVKQGKAEGAIFGIERKLS